MKPVSKPVSATLLLSIDLFGTFVFALQGASTAVQHELDLLGIMVLAFATALGGGIVRDVLIGAIPPNSIKDWRYPATAFFAAAVVFLGHTTSAKYPTGPSSPSTPRASASSPSPEQPRPSTSASTHSSPSSSAESPE